MYIYISINTYIYTIPVSMITAIYAEFKSLKKELNNNKWTNTEQVSADFHS